MRPDPKSIYLALAVLFSLRVLDAGAATPSRAPPGAFAAVNGLRMYYELHGCPRGTPLVLLHGGGSTIEVTYGRILPILARGRCVLAIEEQAHGRTSDRAGPLRFTSSADDVAALLEQLRLGQVDVFGFSNGASTALQLTLRHPRLVRKLVFASSFTKRDGAIPQLWQFMEAATFDNMPQPLKDAFIKVNPDPAALRVMHDKDAERMRHFEDVPDDQLKSIVAPVLVLSGDRDVVKPEHAVELTRLIPNARLLIVPGGHGEYLGEVLASPPASRYPGWTAGLVAEFLDTP
jgi:pimeloyl-ACP methyl ester carboxylesterase